MYPTDIAAWLGALTGTAALVWDVWKWKSESPNVKVIAQPGMQMYPVPHGEKPGPLILVNVRNNGSKPTTVTTVYLAAYESRWSRFCGKSVSQGYVLSPGTSKPLPHKLDIGEEWVGYAKQDEALQPFIDKGILWCEIYHSWSRRPARARVVRPQR